VADTSAPGGTTRRISWGNRLLAPLALIIVLIAIVAIVSANTGDDGNAEQDTKAQINAEKSGGDDGPENPKTYEVEEGDTLGGIAEKFSVSTKRLERLNPDIDPQTLNAGQELKIR
jgi:LysM repeat protein